MTTTPKPTRLAAIDIGSNGVRLLIKEVRSRGGDFTTKKLLFLRVPLRLGVDVFTDGRVSGEKRKKLARLMKVFRQLMKIYDVSDYRACATSAIRDAANGMEAIGDIAEDSNINIRIVSGEEEARIIYNNHYEQSAAAGQNYLYVDVGGGSTEVSLLRDGELLFSHSYNIGTLRTLAGGVSDKQFDALSRDMEQLRQQEPVHIIGSGGNINKLYRLSGVKRRDRSITPDELSTLLTALEPLSPEEREEAFKLKADRADVIVPAARIFLSIAQAIEAKDIQVPVIGLCDGLIDSIIEQQREPGAPLYT